MAVTSIFMPTVAMSTYRNAEPTVDAPAPSRRRARVNDRTSPVVVAMTTIQKNRLVRLSRSSPGALASSHGATMSAMKCAAPVTPKPMAARNMRSARRGMRACSAWNCSTFHLR